MKEIKIIWAKKGYKITQLALKCLCGEIANLIGSAGCNHDNNYTYTYQCPNCKTIKMCDRIIERQDDKSFIEAGWKKLIK